jgi:hypothetical protein
MQIKEFLECVKRYQIPPASPDGTSLHGVGYALEDHYKAREECNNRGMWVIVYQTFAKALADWIGDRLVLEIMAGPGWLAKALQDEDVNIIPTDNGEWDERHTKQVFLTAVAKEHALEAIAQNPDAEILLVSWPPYGEHDVVAACRLWGPGRPIIYIGEDMGGCNAPDEFFKGFRQMTDPPDIDVMSWEGLHDHVFFGYWTEQPPAHRG